MATMNPLEKKARSSFIKGLLIAGLIGIIVIVILTVQIFKMRGEENQRIASQKNVVIIKQDIKSGEEITSDMLLTVKANSEVASTGAMTMADFSTLSTATDDAGNTANLRVLAKIDISAKTVITEDMLSTEETAVSNDLRQQEYNMIVLPSTLADGDTIDIRLILPNGADYIVLSKKKVKLADLNGAVSATTILINVTEDQILTMSAAIVDAYKISGSKLYATKYTDPGLQAVATATYIPSNDTINLIDKDKVVEFMGKSPFDLTNQELWYLPKDAVPGNDENFEATMTNQIEKIIKATDGGVLCLFTSNRNLSLCKRELLKKNIGHK